jgi:hypothetical protein
MSFLKRGCPFDFVQSREARHPLRFFHGHYLPALRPDTCAKPD